MAKYDRYDAERQFEATMRSHGLVVAHGLIADGQIHRCDVADKGWAGKGDGAYLLHLEKNYAAGGFQNWTTGGWVKWKHRRSGASPTAAEKAEIEAAIQQARTAGERETAKKRAEARAKAQRMWDRAEKALDRHRYCWRKNVKPRGLRSLHLRDGSSPLLVPVMDANERIQNLQLIFGDGRKRFLKGGRVGGCHFWVNRPSDDINKPICICEGWATGESVYRATKYNAVVAFNSNNLQTVAQWVRDGYPDHRIIICADDDHQTAGNPGLTAANAAAAAVNGQVAIPVFGEGRGDKQTDFNDMFAAAGAGAVKDAVDADSADSADAADSNLQTDQSVLGDDAAPETQSDHLIRLASSADLFHDAASTGYADLHIGGHRETHAVTSQAFESWLRSEYYRETQSAPGQAAVTAALATIEAKARYDGPQRDVALRVAGNAARIFIDLADKKWQVIEVDTKGWRLVENAPVRFVRRRGMQPLPEPRRGGAIKTLRKYLNVKTDDDFVLIVAWLLAALRPSGPYPVLELNGEEGTAKTTALEVLRELTDPNMAALRAPPREERDLVITASNGHVVGYDNLSHLPDWLSDALARLSTGGGFATRALYTDDEERIFNDTRPILIGAINDVIAQGDLASRTLRLELAPIADDQRRTKDEFWHTFTQDQPGIFGALLDGLAHGLRESPNVRLDGLPRMADFATWATACEGAFWKPGTFMRAYAANIANVTAAVVETDPIGNALLGLLAAQAADGLDEWSGTMTDLLRRLEGIAGERAIKGRYWPQSSATLGRKLRRLAAPLRRLGVVVESGDRQGHGGTRIITVRRLPSALSARLPKAGDNPLRKQAFFAADNADSADGKMRTSHAPVSNAVSRRPAARASLPSRSAAGRPLYRLRPQPPARPATAPAQQFRFTQPREPVASKPGRKPRDR